MTTPLDVRRHLEDMLIADILGPAGGPHEVLPKRDVRRVRDHYLVGMLAPRDVALPAVEENEPVGAGGTADDDGPDDSGLNAAPSLYPSSLGMTVTLDGGVDEVLATAAWGQYLSSDSAEADGDAPTLEWVREPRGGDASVRLLPGGAIEAELPDREVPAVRLDGRWRSIGDVRLLTLFLVNDQPRRDRNADEAWLFQAELSLRGVDGTAVFVGRPHVEQGLDGADAESLELEMLYRNHVEFAVGHGVGVHAEVCPGDRGRATSISTRAVPAYELPRTEAPPVDEVPELAGLVLDMSELATADGPALRGMLAPLVSGYAAWIDRQRARIDDPAAGLERYRGAAERSLTTARATLKRLADGIDLLARDAVAAEAFRFANRAMWQQRIHSTVADRRTVDPSVSVAAAVAAADVPAGRSWRVFQLAFVLVNLPSLTDPVHAERDLVDLLFFPTGGGKTEAYLGLTAYTLAIRRLHGDVAGYDGRDGVAVLMRYTLRLLTSQQFQRAAALICACELIRREAAESGDARWGEVPFRIGMWVGGSVTPNRESEARTAVRTARKQGGRMSGRAASPLPVPNCPWCGSELLGHRDLATSDELRRTLIFCGDELGLCPFTAAKSPREGLPLVTVDETLYRLLPSLVIATADKFAQLPWKGATRNLFGRADDRCERHGWRDADEDRRVDEKDSHVRAGTFEPARTVKGAGPLRPPDLIIQDELHLISGSLGTLVGLYETAIDELASWTVDGRPARPKVVASTATVRRAAQQAQQLFWRRLAVFPPPVLDVEDSFFARQRVGLPGRRYLGVCARGVRLKAVEIRMFVALLAAGQTLFEAHPDQWQLVDPYMTLVGYFSAVRELAGMRRLVDDDVAQRLTHAERRGYKRRGFLRVEELTSRAGSTEIPQALRRLKLTHRPRDRQQGRAGAREERPVDVLLATNMISVGVDVPRLGLMLVAGQPKATAEYIQATSRVGREHDRGPGLVVTVYNWARPRDLSHYESFEHYHATLYKHVEGLSVTPFAPRALDRGLAAVVASLLRHRHGEWNPNQGAQRVVLDGAEVERVRSLVMNRAEALTSDPEAGAQVGHKFDTLIDDWRKRRANRETRVSYDTVRDGSSRPLLVHSGTGAWQLWTCPNSLRETEPTINILLEPGDPSLDAAPPFTVDLPDSDGANDDDGEVAETETEAEAVAELGPA